MSSPALAEQRPAPKLQISGLEKAFGANRVLRGVDLTVGPGEFLGFMGPNGAGKSTLIKILDGLYEADSGQIEFGGDRVRNLSSRPEVGFIHQDLGLIDDLSITENLRLGQPKVTQAGVLIDHRRERSMAEATLELVELDRDVDVRVGELSAGERTLVAIARSLSRGARLLIVDEATSNLTGAGAEMLVQRLKGVVGDGAAVVMVSHKLGEILGATDRVVVLIDGRIAADQPRESLDRAGLARLLYAHEAQDEVGREEAAAGAEAVTLRRASARRCGPVDLVVRRGEVVGLTGVPGSGMHDIAALAAGLLRPEAGDVWLEPGARAAFVPAHRESEGGFDQMPVIENMTISSLFRWQLPGGLLRGRQERGAAEEVMDALAVKPPDLDERFVVLSGGNKQKVIFGRALLRRAGVYVFCEPTRGVDVKTRGEIYTLIRRLRDEERAAVLVVSSDAEDLFAVCDRVAAVDDGRCGSFHRVGDLSPTEIGELV